MMYKGRYIDDKTPILESGIFPRHTCEGCKKDEDKPTPQVGIYLIDQDISVDDEFTGVVFDIDCLPEGVKGAVEDALTEMDLERMRANEEE